MKFITAIELPAHRLHHRTPYLKSAPPLLRLRTGVRSAVGLEMDGLTIRHEVARAASAQAVARFRAEAALNGQAAKPRNFQSLRGCASRDAKGFAPQPLNRTARRAGGSRADVPAANGTPQSQSSKKSCEAAVGPFRFSRPLRVQATSSACKRPCGTRLRFELSYRPRSILLAASHRSKDQVSNHDALHRYRYAPASMDTPVDRQSKYAADSTAGPLVYAFLVESTIAKGSHRAYRSSDACSSRAIVADARKTRAWPILIRPTRLCGAGGYAFRPLYDGKVMIHRTTRLALVLA